MGEGAAPRTYEVALTPPMHSHIPEAPEGPDARGIPPNTKKLTIRKAGKLGKNTQRAGKKANKHAHPQTNGGKGEAEEVQGKRRCCL